MTNVSSTVGKPGPKKISIYDSEIERLIKDTFNLLSEKDKRIYAAVETLKLQRGGQSYISRIIGCTKNLIRHGIEQFKAPETIPKDKQRKNGGGRKTALESINNINKIFSKVIENYTAGDPMDNTIKWTNLSREKIAKKMALEGITVSVTVVKKLLKKHDFKKRKAQKKQSIGHSEQRNEQFENIAKLKSEYMQTDNPIISIDTKKKELLGNLYREGKCYSTDVIKVYDHDFPHLATGNVIPHTIYDIKNNSAFVNIGVSKDTSEFACDSIKYWWMNEGQLKYPNASSILMLADGGGSNSSRHYIFKEDLQKLVDEIGIEIRVAHYPPYTSKWNPVEHKVFPHITRSLQGVIIKSYELVKELIDQTSTKTGLKIRSNIITQIYETGRKYAEDFKETMRIIFDDYLGQWNYKVVPIKT